MLYFFLNLFIPNDLSDNCRELAAILFYLTRVQMFTIKKKNIYYIFHLFAGSTGELLCLIPTKARDVFMLCVLTLFYYSWRSHQSGLSGLVRRSRLASDWLAASLPRAQRAVESVSQVHLPSRMWANGAKVKTVILFGGKLSLPSQRHHWLD